MEAGHAKSASAHLLLTLLRQKCMNLRDVFLAAPRFRCAAVGSQHRGRSCMPNGGVIRKGEIGWSAGTARAAWPVLYCVSSHASKATRAFQRQTSKTKSAQATSQLLGGCIFQLTTHSLQPCVKRCGIFTPPPEGGALEAACTAHSQSGRR
jgi:hypothetical protein